MKTDWFYTQQGKAAPVPVPPAQLKQLADTGQLQPTDLVWQEGLASWVTASTIKGLFPNKHTAADQPILNGPPNKDKPPADLLETSPLFVFLLTLGTLGIFGLIYAHQVCFRFAEASNRRTTDKAGRTLGPVRHPFGVLLLAYLTFGYSFYVWIYRVIQECQAFTGRSDFNARVELSLMLIFPPYAIYLAVIRLPDLIKRTQEMAGVPEAPALQLAPRFINPLLFLALPYLGMIYQDALNQTWMNAP
jgi:hypothetical protein